MLAGSNLPGLVTIIIPCRNEELYVENCINSVLAFDRPEGVDFEVLVMDGKSSDRTIELANSIASTDGRVRVIDNPGKIQSTALNKGLREARGSWIMRLDAHAVYPRDYLTLCYETAIRSGADNVGGLFIAETSAKTYPAKVVQALTTHKFGVGDAGYRTGAKEAYADTVPYGFFKREIFDRIGGLDERLVRAQDYEFNRRIAATGGKVLRNPAIRVYYFNQPTLRRFFSKQFFREAPYNAYLWYLAPYAFASRHAITGVFAVGVIGGLLVSPFVPWIKWGFIGVMALYYLLAFGASCQQAVRYKQPMHIVILPIFFFLYHFLHGVGVLHGIIRLLIRTAPVQQKSEPWPGAGWRRVPVAALRQKS